MLRINKLGKALLGAFLLISVAQSMEEEIEGKLQPEVSTITLENNPAQPREFFQAPSIKIIFPKEKEKIKEEIAKGSPCIHIYIPRENSNASFQETASFFEYTSNDLENVEYLIINHSAKSGSGYWRAAVNALVPLVKNAQNLKKITLSQVLADDFLPHIRPGVNIYLDCECAYAASDTIYRKEDLIGLSTSLLPYYQETYPNHKISTLEIKGFRGTGF